MPLIPLDDGLKPAEEDFPGAVQTVVNWMTDTSGGLRLRPAISNQTLDPGVYAATSGTLTGIIGSYVWDHGDQYLVYVRQDRTVWAKSLTSNFVQALSSVAIPTSLLDGSRRPVFAEDSLRLIIAGGGQLQTWSGGGLTTRISATVFGVNEPPLAATHVVSLANYLVANDTRPGFNNQIFWSGQGDANHTSWFPLNFNSADAEPDPIVALGANSRELYAWGTKTLQVFGIGSDPLLPFAATAAIAIGNSAPYSVIRYDDQWAWLDGTRRFVMGNGRDNQEISSDINRAVRALSTVSDCFGFRAQTAFWDLLVWVFPTAGEAFVYNVPEKKWRRWNSWDGIQAQGPLRVSSAAQDISRGWIIVTDPLYENLWTLDPTSETDTGPGQPIVADLITKRIDWDVDKRKRRLRTLVYVKRGTAAQDAADTGYLECAKRDDEGDWSAPKRLNLGRAGDYTSSATWYPGGIYRRTQYRFRYSSGLDIALSRAIESFEECVD